MAACALLLLSAGVSADELTGISRDFSHYRVGKRKVCALATVDPASRDVLYDAGACVELTPAKQRAYGFALPPAPRAVTLPDGRGLRARVEVRPRDPEPRGEVGCLTKAGSRCPSAEEMRLFAALSPQPGDLILVARAPGGAEVELARTSGTARAVRSLRASHDGTRVIIEYTFEKTLRDAMREPPLGVDVLGLSLPLSPSP